MRKWFTLLAAASVLSGCIVAPAPAPHRHDERDYRREHRPAKPVRDRDGDGVPDRYDRDRDGDGVPNRYDRAPDNPYRR